MTILTIVIPKLNILTITGKLNSNRDNHIGKYDYFES